VALERNVQKQMRLNIFLKALAVVPFVAAATFGCTITPEIPAAQIARAGMPSKPQPFYIPVSVSSGCTLKFVGLINAYPLTATFGPSSIQPGTVGVSLMDSGAPLPVVPFYATGLAVLEATDDASGRKSLGTITVYFYGLTN
jgi:hypothetical protein